MFKLKFETDTAFFMESKGLAIAAILKHLGEGFELTHKVLDGNTTGDKGSIFDFNGNCVGQWEYRP